MTQFKKIALFFIISHSAIFAGESEKEDYLFYEKWSVSYLNTYGNVVYGQVNNPSKWDFPKYIDCYIGPDPLENIEKRKIYERGIICGKKEMGSLQCEANGAISKCEKKIENFTLFVTIRRYPKLEKRRSDAYEEEKKNTIPY